MKINKNFLSYWELKSTIIQWYKKPKKILNYNKKKKRFCWYKDGQTNIYHNCVENNLYNFGNKCAIKYIDKNNKITEVTYSQLFNLVENFSFILKKKTKKKNKIKVAIHASASLEAAVSMLACCKLGIEFTVIFQNLPPESILARLNIFKPNILISRDDILNVKKNIIPLIKKYNTSNTNKIKFIYFSSLNKVKNKINISLQNLLRKKILKKKIHTKKLFSDYSSFVLFTSGSTGQPKGAQHTTAGYLLYTKLTCIEQFGMHKNSVVLTLSDAGWINGHSYALFGPLSIGATTLLIENPLMLLNSNLLKEVINKHEVTILYLPVTIIRLLKASMERKILNIKKLECLGSMCEPLAKNISNWFSKIFTNNRLAVVNTYFQSETGGILCSPKFNDKPAKKFDGTVGKPVNEHIKLNIFNKKNKNKITELKVNNPWPGCMKNIINGKHFYKKYFDKKNNFLLFDIGKLDTNKNLLVYGRSDDVMNVRGHRIGSGEIEDQILQIERVKEVCAVSCKNEIEGSKIVIFYSKKNQNHDKLSQEINIKIIEYFGSWAKPEYIIELSQLPKTRSGKILRRLLRILINDPKEKNIGDVSTILDKRIINEIRLNVLKIK